MMAGQESAHILFVDEEPAIQRRVAKILADGAPGLRLTCASDGAEALRLLDRGGVDLLITSLVMPVIDGVALLRHLANRRAAPPVIVVSEHEPPAAELRVRSGCRVEHLCEPLAAEPLLRCVHALLHDGPAARRGVTLIDLLVVLRMARTTGALRVTAGAEQGMLLFATGALIDARLGELMGLSAALEILRWQRPVLALDALVRARSPTVFATLTELLAALPRGAAEVAGHSVRQGGARGRGERGHQHVAEPAAGLPATSVASLSLVPALAPGVETPVLVAAPELRALPVSSRGEPEVGPAPDRANAPWEQPGAQVKIRGAVAEALDIDGAVAAALASWELDHSLGAVGGPGEALEAAVSAHCRVMRAMSTLMTRVGSNTGFRDLLITADDGQLDILAPLRGDDGLFLWVAIDQRRGSLALARRRVQKIVGELVL